VAAQDTAAVEGVVMNKVTGAGIPGVTVWLWSSGTNSYKAVTNETGIFHIFGLTPGDYSSRVEKPGYSGTDPEVLALLADPPKRHISAGPEPVRLRFELNPPAVLRGRVIGTDGNPARATVEIAGGRTEKTNPEGIFAFENIQPGRYTLLARPITEHASGKDAIRIEPVPTYYPSVLDGSLAETILVRAGAELNGYEIRLQSAEVHRVRGIVLDPDGKPSAKATVELQAQVSPRGPGIAFNIIGPGGLNLSIANFPGAGRTQEQPVVTAEDGVFEFPSVRSGEWTIQARSDWVRDEIQHRNILRMGSAGFRVDREDPDELKIQFPTPFSLSLPTAIVMSDGSVPAPGVSVVVNLTSETGPSGRIVEIKGGGVLQVNEVIPGRYQIRADVVAGNYYVDSISLGSTNITGQSVELTPVPLPVKIILKPAGTVIGTIEEADAGAIVLFPQNLTGTGYSVQTGVGRTFEINSVRPDEYYAIALDQLDPDAIADAVRLRGLIPRATSVRVEPGSSLSVQLKVNHLAD
jgi:protocatechuate 3,4-dioxygenase beta subunit